MGSGTRDVVSRNPTIANHARLGFGTAAPTDKETTEVGHEVEESWPALPKIPPIPRWCLSSGRDPHQELAGDDVFEQSL